MKFLSQLTGLALLSLFILAGSSQSLAEKATLFWFGNSYSDAGRIFRNIPAMVNGDFGIAETTTLVESHSIEPSCWSECHETRGAFSTIDNGHYRYVVLQDGNAYFLYPSNASASASMANRYTTWATHARNAGGVLVLEQIWNGPPANYANAQAAQDRNDFWYDSLCRATNSILAPCGHAWWLARQEKPALEYIDPAWNDGAHPGSFGAYLNQCVFYAVFTGVSPVGLTFRKTTFNSDIILSDEDALFAQQKAWEAYLDFNPPDAPDISTFSATPGAALFGVQTPVTITATVTGTSPITSVVLDLGAVGGLSNIQLTGTAGNYTHSFSAPASLSLGGKTISLKAIDNTGKCSIARIRFNIEQPPVLKAARASYNNTRIAVEFSEQVDQSTAENTANYSIDKGVTISDAVMGPDSNVVTLTTSSLSINTVYTLTVNNIRSLASAVPANSQDTFQFYQGGTGYIYAEIGIKRYVSQISSVETMTPDSTDTLTSFSLTKNYGSGAVERIQGYLYVPVTGTYKFYAQGWDQVQLSLSTDENPANKQVLVTGGGNEAASETINLVEGHSYFIQALERTNGASPTLTIKWEGPGIAKSVIEGKYLSPLCGDGECPTALSPQVFIVQPSAAISIYSKTGPSLSIRINHAGSHRVVLTDMKGSRLMSEKGSGPMEYYLRKNFGKGVYVIRILVNGKKYSQVIHQR